MSDDRPAKSVENLALQVFQRYYDELSRALSGCPDEAAADLYSARMITTQEKSQVVGTLGLSPFRKADCLMEAVERRIATENSAVPLRDFCRLFQRRYGVDSILARMKLRLAYVEQHHELPNDDWSSYTECEQRISSPAQQEQLPPVNVPPPMRRHSDYLKDLYKRRLGMSLKWPPVLMKDFVNLLCIESHHELDEEVTEEMVCGRIDQLEKTRRTIQLHDLGSIENGETSNCILVQEAPGSGKTMFSWEVCRRWGQGQLLQQYPLVIMLPLRDTDILNARSLEDLFPHSHKPFQKEVAEAVECEAGKGVLFLLDGFDELPAVKRKESSFLMKLVTGKLLPLATVMVTSRPWAFKPLLVPKYISRISQHIEIVGFTSNNINQYINKAFPNAIEREKFCAYLSTCPHIRSTMYIPLNCAIVVEVYNRSSGSKQPTPKTMTQLYIALVRELLLRHIESCHKGFTKTVLDLVASIFHRRRRVHFFEDFPSTVYQQLCTISSIAYQGLSNNQQLIFSDLPANFETLGLLQRVSQLYGLGEKVVSYNFLHLTVQEFLSAFHIVLQNPSEHQKLFRALTMEKGEKRSGACDTSAVDNSRHGENPSQNKHMQNSEYLVRMFAAGLSEGMDYHAPVPVSILEAGISALHLLFESQNKLLATSELGDESIIRSVHMSSLSPHDAYVLGYCIAQGYCQWKLNLYNIRDEHTEIMKRAITNWGSGKGKIIRIYSRPSNLTTDGISHLLSLPHDVLSNLSELHLAHAGLDVKPGGVLAHHLSSLIQHLKKLSLCGYGIGCEGAELLSQPLCTTTTLRQLDLSRNDIKDKGGCSLAKALSKNKGLEVVCLRQNPLGEETIRELMSSLQHNHTLTSIYLSRPWEEFACRCNGYNTAQCHFSDP